MKEELEEQLERECKYKGNLTYSQARSLLLYTPYSFRSNSVRKRRAYRALLNYLTGDYHSLSSHTNAEIHSMIKAIHDAPTKLVTEKDEYRFSLPEKVSFVNLTEKRYELVETIEEVEVKKGHFEKVPDIVTLVESKVHKEVEGDTTDDEGWEMSLFDPDVIADKIGRSRPYSQSKWWYKNPVRYCKEIPPRIHHYLTHRHYLYDGDQVRLSELLERRFHRWVEFEDEVRTVVKELRVPVPDKYVIEIEKEQRKVKRPALINKCIKNEIAGLKPNQKWVDELVELTYLPGFSVLRGEMLPYKKINAASYDHKFYSGKNKKRKNAMKEKVRKLSEKREKLCQESVSDEELDEIIRENARLILENPKMIWDSKLFFEQGRQKMSWIGLRYLHAAFVAMRTGADAYDILREKVFENYNVHKRVIKAVFDLDDY